MKDQGSAKGKILVVEDDEGVAKFIKTFLKERGHHCEIAKDGIKAQEFLDKGKYRLILTDVIFFQSGGIDLINTIRKKDKTTPIVVMTGYGQEVAQEAMEAGANDFLLKPFDILQMTRKIEKFVDLDRLENRFGIIAVEKGFITADQLIKVLKTQIEEDIEKGKHRLIGRILLEQGLITFPQIDEVVEALGKGNERSD